MAVLQNLTLQNFRNYSRKSFDFGEGTTLIVGPNASGKTNILEAIYALAIGKSFRAETDGEMIKDGGEFFRVTGETESEKLEVFEQIGQIGQTRQIKLYKINGVGKRQQDFVGHLRAVLFSPQDIEIVADSPSTRRRYLDLVLTLVHRDYRVAGQIYEKALRARNRLLWTARELRIMNHELSKQLGYWDKSLIENGETIHRRRKEFIDFLNKQKSEFFSVKIEYDYSLISAERLAKYHEQSLAAAMTLVGPHRDDFKIKIKNPARGEARQERQRLKTKVENDGRDAKSYGSRGEQRMAVFTMKLGELAYVRSMTGSDPVMLLDDIFSELDHENRKKLLEVIPQQQTIITTTDLHLVDRAFQKKTQVIELGV